MKLKINGNINSYYVQTLCMIFFPGAKFSETEIYTDETPEVIVSVHKDGNMISSDATINAFGKTESYKHTVDSSLYESELRAEKIAVGGAVYTAGSRLFGHEPPWGMLIGVRPSKLAMDYFNSGLNLTCDEVADKLCADFFTSPEKAKLTCDVALREKRIIEKFSNENLCSVYISIPFCPTRCDYCSFVSYTTKGLLKLMPEYAARLKIDILNTFRLINELGMKVVTVYIGGGTPTTMCESLLDGILAEIEKHTDVTALFEYTLEAGRPDTITKEKLYIAKTHGVNRISVNTQTLNDSILEKIGRKHTALDFYRSFDIAKNSGIEHINTDLIAGLPDETCESFSESLDKVINLRPDNVTIHTFCVKKSAEILQKNKNIYSAANIEAEKGINYSQKTLVINGYHPYYMYKQKNAAGNLENVGFALEGCEGLYNIFMMEEIHSIFSVGAGGVTKYLKRNKDGKTEIKRIFSSKYPYEYLRNNEPCDLEEIYRKQKEGAISFFNTN